MPADRHRYPPLRPRRLAGVRVDHSRQVGAGRTGVRLAIDFEPLPEDAAGGYTFAVDAPAPERALPRKPIERLGWQLGREWEEEGYLREVFAVRAVLRRAEWHTTAPAAKGADSLCSVLDSAAALAVREAVQALAEDRDPRPVGCEARGRPPALPRAVSGVYVRHIRQTSCSGPFAVVWADVEPLPEDTVEDYAFAADLPEVCRHPGEPLPAEFAAAFSDGVREAWELRGGGRPVFAARVVLRDAIWHETDSSEYGFRAAGRIAAHEVLRCVAEDRDPRPAGCAARQDKPIPPMPRTQPAP
ncbi:MAG: hypothetical protein M0026_15345 [Nocardiopsaceae bacterium]|nr:hypothetical protein [Nocardiopsaceae bacterium]